MKHIKTFNENFISNLFKKGKINKNYLYSEISKDEFLKLQNKLTFDIKEATDIINNLLKIDKFKVSVLDGTNWKKLNVANKERNIPIDYISVFKEINKRLKVDFMALINKGEDDYYYIQIKEGSIYNLDYDDSLFYKCDQLDQVYGLISDKLKK